MKRFKVTIEGHLSLTIAAKDDYQAIKNVFSDTIDLHSKDINARSTWIGRAEEIND